MQEANKGNYVLYADRNIYDKHLKNILQDQNKFRMVKIKAKHMNFQVKHAEHIDESLKSLKYSGNLNFNIV